MKPETEKGLRAASVKLQQEVIRLLFDIMDARDFIQGIEAAKLGVVVDALSKEMEPDDFMAGLMADSEPGEDDRLTDKGTAIFTSLIENFGPDEPEPAIDAGEYEFTRLHEAICDGRRDDALTLLDDITDGRYGLMPFNAYASIFPERVSL